MAKVIKYELCTDANHSVEIVCKTEAIFDANYPIAEKEAVPGTIEVIGEFDPADEMTEAERIKELEEALEMLLSGVTE